MGTSDSIRDHEFGAQMRKLYPHQAEAYFDALNQPAPISIRLNAGKKSGDIPFLNYSTPVPWESNAFYLSERPSFTLDPNFHAGKYYVQEASSMMIGAVAEQIIRRLNPSVNTTTSLRILDLCGAPGGKSTHLLDKLLPTDLLVTNEVIRSRSSILTENIIKWGCENVAVTCNDPEHFRSLGPWFDMIVVDAPCSGEGLFRKDPDAIKEWSTDAVSHCALRQNRILDAIWPVLKPGGFLIYSTCTYNPAENDEQIIRLLESGEAESIEITTDTMTGIIADKISPSGAHIYRCLPGFVHGEGLTFSVIKKKEQATANYPEVSYSSKNVFTRVKGPVYFDALKDAESRDFLQNKNAVYAVPNVLVRDILELDSILNIVHVGVELGDEKRPAHSLAMSQSLMRGNFPEIDVDEDLALEYLRRETIRITSQNNGIHLIVFNGIPLGFGKVTQGRVNNHYPMEWRIRMRK
jgi:16S rRNA C967 or C1407 C5-methylase (RsmB/RsmF family)/NOL1/NOP2/fmu family ribosome biogenesis protein